MSVDSWTSEGMDWTSPNSIKTTWPYVEALRLATIERCYGKGISTSITFGGGNSQFPFQTIDIATRQCPCDLTTLLYAIYAKIYFNLLDGSGYVDHDVNGGDFTGLSYLPYYNTSSMLSKIGEVSFSYPIIPYSLTYYSASNNELMFQLYKVLNQLRWCATIPYQKPVFERREGIVYKPWGSPETPEWVEQCMIEAETAWQQSAWIDERNLQSPVEYCRQQSYFEIPYGSDQKYVVRNTRCKVKSVSTIFHFADFYATTLSGSSSYKYYSTDGFIENKYNKYASSNTEALEHETNYIMETMQRRAYLNDIGFFNFSCHLYVYYYVSSSKNGRVVKKYDSPNGFKFKD